MMSKKRKKLGKKGEKIACLWLKKKGYRILETNFQILPWGEIDIVAQRGETLVFFEIKTRRAPVGPFKPEARINYEKKKRLISACQIYLSQNNIPLDAPWQIDVLAIEIIPQQKAKIRHFENAVRQ